MHLPLRLLLLLLLLLPPLLLLLARVVRALRLRTVADDLCVLQPRCPPVFLLLLLGVDRAFVRVAITVGCGAHVGADGACIGAPILVKSVVLAWAA